MRVLVVMRGSAQREDLRAFLRRTGWQVEVWDPESRAKTPTSLLDVDLLLVDEQSLASSGMRLLSLRRHVGTRIPCILMGAASDLEPKSGVFTIPASATLQEIAALAINCLHDARRDSRSAPFLFSDREWSVFSLLGEGRSNVHIAEQLGISVKTVEAHKENMKRKLRLESAEALRMAAIDWSMRRKSARL